MEAAGVYTVGDLVAEFLERCEVSTAFGIVSIHNTPILDAIGRRGVIRFVMARGELGAGHMADGHARASGALGVLVTSTGPGAANAVGSLLEARVAGTPVLHLTGHTATAFAGRAMGVVHDPHEQGVMLASVSKAALRIRSAEQAFGILQRAAIEALTPPHGPVTVEIPIDIQRSPVRRPDALDNFILPLRLPARPPDSIIDELARRVSEARRPMLWMGAGARHAGGPALRLLELGFGMVTSLHGRGVVPDDHPLNLGAFSGSGQKAVQDLYRHADLLLVAGSRLRGYETAEFRLPLPENLILVDADPEACGRTYPSRYFACGDSQDILTRLVDRLQDRMHVEPDFTDQVRQTKRTVRASFRASLGPYAGFAETLRDALPANGIWVRDITMSNSTWGHRLFSLSDPSTNIYSVSGGIGQGLPMAVGAALDGSGRKVMLLTGDGGFQMNIGELWTAIQEGANMVVIVMNDRGYGAIRQVQDIFHAGRHFFTDLVAPDLESIAAGAGLAYRRVDRAEALGNAVDSVIGLPGVSIVEVDMTAIGPIPPYDYSRVGTSDTE